MWLKDFLPKDFETNVRILTYGYNSSLKESGKRGLLEYRRTFVQNLTNARNSPMVKIQIIAGSLKFLVIT